MTLVRTILAAAIACGMALTAAPATAADCYAIGQRVAAQNGGTLARATQSVQGGKPVF